MIDNPVPNERLVRWSSMSYGSVEVCFDRLAKYAEWLQDRIEDGYTLELHEAQWMLIYKLWKEPTEVKDVLAEAIDDNPYIVEAPP